MSGVGQLQLQDEHGHATRLVQLHECLCSLWEKEEVDETERIRLISGSCCSVVIGDRMWIPTVGKFKLKLLLREVAVRK